MPGVSCTEKMIASAVINVSAQGDGLDERLGG
jgi:hypothetical protein